MLPALRMQLFKFLKMFTGFANVFFMLPALVRCGIAVVLAPTSEAKPGVTPLYCNNAIQLQRSHSKPLIKYILIALLSAFIITQKTNAQTPDTIYTDTSYVDTVSMKNADESPGGYDDNEEGYADTAVQHIYDTSQYFFTWKEYLNDPYTTTKIAQRLLLDSAVNQLKTEDDFWYIPVIEKMERRIKNDPKYRDSLLNLKNRELQDENANSILMQPWFNTLIWVILLGVFIAAVLYFLIQNKINIFSRTSASSADDATSENEEDIFHLSYTKLILKAEKENDYRVAIRLMFLQTLKLLSDTNSIHYQPDYTNLHYLQQLHQSKFYNEFSKASRSYEYVWYGRFDISAARYAAVKNDFVKLQNRIQ